MQPDVCTSKVSIWNAAVFFYRTTNLIDCVAAAHQIYTRGSAVDWTRSRLSAFSTISPLLFFNLRGSKSAKSGLEFRHHSSLSRPRCETKQHIGTKAPSFLQRWWSSVLPNFGPPNLRSRSWKSAPLKRANKFAKSSITQPYIIRLCWKLAHWCSICPQSLYWVIVNSTSGQNQDGR